MPLAGDARYGAWAFGTALIFIYIQRITEWWSWVHQRYRGRNFSEIAWALLSIIDWGAVLEPTKQDNKPGAYATDFGSPSSLKFASGMDAYANLRTQVFGRLSSMEKGDPAATPEAILKIVDAEDPPLRFFVGNTGLPTARAAYAARLATWEAWQAVSNSAQGEPRK